MFCCSWSWSNWAWLIPCSCVLLTRNIRHFSNSAVVSGPLVLLEEFCKLCRNRMIQTPIFTALRSSNFHRTTSNHHGSRLQRRTLLAGAFVLPYFRGLVPAWCRLATWRVLRAKQVHPTTVLSLIHYHHGSLDRQAVGWRNMTPQHVWLRLDSTDTILHKLTVLPFISNPV